MNTVKKKLYFGHPKDEYNTEYELNCMEYIRCKYPDCDWEIINPKDIKIDESDKNLGSKGYSGFMEQMRKYYWSEIDKCDLLLVARTRRGKVSPGVQKEIGYAKQKGIDIEYLDVVYPKPNRHTITCYFCGEQIVIEGEISEDERSEYEIKDNGDNWRLACGFCSGIDVHITEQERMDHEKRMIEYQSKRQEA